MNCWVVLDIEPTSDKKQIKVAYAALLKHNKPDENPQGFSQLHAAYKQALQDAAQININNEQVEIDQESHSSLSSERYQSSSEEFALDETHSDSCDDELTLSDDKINITTLEDVKLQLTAQVEEVLVTENSANDKSNWLFLENREELYDLQLKSEFSYYLFGRLLDFIEDEAGYELKKSIFDYLDGIFRWHDKREHLEDYYGFDNTQQLFDLPENSGEQLEKTKEKKSVPEKPVIPIDKFKWVRPLTVEWLCEKVHTLPVLYSNRFSRFSALIVDLFLLYLLQLIIIFVSNLFGQANFLSELGEVLGTVFLFLIVPPIMESTSLQGSFGKILFGMKVVSKKGKRLNIVHSLIRHLFYVISMVGFKISVIINIFIYDGRYLHDKLSYSMVINRLSAKN